MTPTHTSMPPPITHVLETCLYVKNITESVSFYKSVFGIEAFLDTSRMAGFSLGPTMLLLFQLGATASDTQIPHRGLIPGHGPSSPILSKLLANGDSDEKGREVLKQHFCLAVDSRGAAEEWEARLREKGVKILGTMDWERGGRSVYFADPDGHVGEVGSRGIWPSY